ncbi:HuvX protein [Vibrio azureus]|uniref:Heme utilization cystosolic carrier protein HutX n=1 Tax=Vibrio azureus NBRC 104587 TaxID=1219077 RepID=U3ANC1_9VIBR|nr:heme utilization cystosolic carrier protein HutX [Vibrio azureus]AUI87828.1 HuvX protein [Vibrio azureus]GAD74787.1 hypothetical protein VAZ01S_015_00310 [Vibrio azureus NBRC 104587]
MNLIKEQVAKLLVEEPRLLPAAIAEKLDISEFEVVAAFPQGSVAIVSGEYAQSILEQLVDFGPVTTIMHSFGSIFEFKGPIPKGKVARGYYNLMAKPGQLDGHLSLDNIKHVALVSKPFMGRESHYFGFFSECGSNIFKIYLGRDEKRELIPSQVTAFLAMQSEFNQARTV